MTDGLGHRELDPIVQAMHELPYGVYAIGSTDAAGPNVMVADWVMQVSFEPRLVVVAFEHDSSSLGRVRSNAAFTLNLLAADADSMRMAMQFVQPAAGAKVEGRSAAEAARHHHKLAGVAHTLSERGLPILDAAVAWLECEATQYIEAGDHMLVIGRVLDGGLLQSVEPMTTLYTGWTYSG